MPTRRRLLVAVVATVGAGGVLYRPVSDRLDGDPGTSTGDDDGSEMGPNRASRTHPYADGTVSVVIDSTLEGSDRFERLVSESLDYWSANAEQYLEYDVDGFELSETSTDAALTITEVESVSDCDHLDGDEVAGCADLVRPQDDAALPLEAEVEPVPGDWQYRRLISHEIGHTLGLEHDDDPQSIMSDDRADWYPEYEQRSELQELYLGAIEAYNEGVDAIDDANAAMNDEQYAAAETAYVASLSAFERAIDAIEDAREIAAELSPFEPADRERLRDLLEDATRHVEHTHEAYRHYATAAERLANGDPVDGAIDDAEAAFSDSQDVAFPSSREITLALGFPAPRDADA